MVVGGVEQRRVQAPHLRAGIAMLAADLAGRADRDHAALGGAKPDRGDRGRDRVLDVVQGRRLDQDNDQGRVGRDDVGHLEVEYLLAVGQPG